MGIDIDHDSIRVAQTDIGSELFMPERGGYVPSQNPLDARYSLEGYATISNRGSRCVRGELRSAGYVK
jgi:hypothetical protein